MVGTARLLKQAGRAVLSPRDSPMLDMEAGSFRSAGNSDLTSTAVDSCDVAVESCTARCVLVMRNRKQPPK